jgi:putative membrane protein
MPSANEWKIPMKVRTGFCISVSMLLAVATFPARAAEDAAKTDKTVSTADTAFVAMVSQGGMFEVEASKVAKDKAAQQDVIDTSFAEVHDHELVGAKLKSIAGTINLPFPTELNAEFKGRLDALKALSGKAFDDAYIKEMEVIHTADGAAFAKEAKAGQDTDLKAFAAETVLIVKRHIGSLHAVPLPTT